LGDLNRPESRSQPPRPSTRWGLVCWAVYDWANSPFAAVIQTFVFAAYFTRQVAENETVGTAEWGNAIGVAGLLVAVCGPLLGATADRGGRRKLWIAAFTVLGVAATALLWFVRPSPDYARLALVLVGVGTVAVELATIPYNAMLPSLAPPEKLGRWSGWGWGLGYAGGLACLVVALFGFIEADWSSWGFEPEAAANVRATFVLTAVWYLLFSLPFFLVTPDAPGTATTLARAVREGWAQMMESLGHARRYGHILRFLVARMIYTDGLATVFAFGGVYAAGTLNMTEAQVLTFGIALNISAGLGAAAFSWIDDRLGSKRTVVISLLGLMATASAVLLVRSQALFWVFGNLLGVFVGPAQAASRSYLARLAPLPLRNQMFGLYAFSGKATAFAGPLLVGWLTYLSGSQRLGMATVIAFFLVGLLLLLTVPDPQREGL
jgi:UMF1 family MFS transporter